MSTWTLIQIVFDIFMACGIFVIVMRMNRAPKDDPRLSRGLQLLQSKIAVLEDLSDRTELQVGQLTAILESKSREVQAKVQLAEQHVHEIRVSMERSLEVAQIFQDKIPHKEIIERQNTIKYVQAARMAHQGASVEDIAKKVDLPRGEVEFLASVNRDRLMFSESELPEWAKTEELGAAPSDSPSFSPSIEGAASFGGGVSFTEEIPTEDAADQSTRLRAEMELAESQRLVENLSRLQFEMQNLDMQLARENSTRDFSAAYDVPKVETESLKKLGEEFRKAVKEGEASDARPALSSALGTGLPSNFGASMGSSLLPPLEQLTSLIPKIIEAGHETSGENSQVANTQAPAQRAYGRQAAQPAAAHAAPLAAPEAPRDPALARAVAQAKVQAALRSSAKSVALAPKATNPELAAARALAKEVSPGASTPTSTSSGKPKMFDSVVRKVVFPRIDGSDV